MNRYLKKYTGNILVVALIFSTLPVQTVHPAETKQKEAAAITDLFSEKDIAETLQIEAQKVQDKIKIQPLTPEEINKKLKTIKKTMKNLKFLKAVLDSIAIGAIGIAGIGVGAAIVASVIVLIKDPKPRFITSGLNPFEWTAIGAVVAAVTAAVVAGIAAMPELFDLFGGLSSKIVLESMLYANQLTNIEKKYPGTLTQAQQNNIAQFKNMTHGPLLKGIVKGIKIDLAVRDHTLEVLEENPTLVAQFFGKLPAINKVTNYLKMKINEEVMQATLAEHNKNVEKIKKQISKTKNLFEKAILRAQLTKKQFDLHILLLKRNIKKLQKKITTFAQKYPSIVSTSESHIDKAIQEVEQLVEEFKQPS